MSAEKTMKARSAWRVARRNTSDLAFGSCAYLNTLCPQAYSMVSLNYFCF